MKILQTPVNSNLTGVTIMKKKINHELGLKCHIKRSSCTWWFSIHNYENKTILFSLNYNEVVPDFNT